MVTILAALALAATPPAGLNWSAPVADLGETKSGPPLSHTFTVTNANREPVRILGVDAGCGCVRRDVSKTSLAPGESADITLTVNTLTQPAGPNTWRGTVRFAVGADGPPQSVELTIKARLVREVSVSPPSLAFSTAAGATQTLTVTDIRKTPLTVTRAAATSPHLTATVRPAARGMQEIVVVLAPDLPVGEHDDAVVLTTDDPAYPELRVPVRVSKRSPDGVTASPAAVDLRFAAGQPELSALVQLRAGGKPVAVERVESDDPTVRAKWSAGAGPVATVRVTVPAGTGKTTVRVTLAEPAGKVVAVPVSWSGSGSGK